MNPIGRGKEITFKHAGNTYTARRTAVWTFFIHLPGRDNPARMFSTTFDVEKVRRRHLIEELVNRENQRKSVTTSIWGGYTCQLKEPTLRN